MVHPNVIVLVHTASSYTLSPADEATLLARLASESGCPVVTVSGASQQALAHLGVQKVALATPYTETISQQGKVFLQTHGLDVVNYQRLLAGK